MCLVSVVVNWYLQVWNRFQCRCESREKTYTHTHLLQILRMEVKLIMRNMERYRLQRHRPWSTFYLIETWNCHLVVIFENKHHGTNDSSDPSCRWIYKMSKKDDEEHLGSSSWTRVFDSRDRCGGVVGDDCKMCIKDSEVLKKWKNLTMDEWWNGCSFDESCNKSFGWFFWRSHSWL